MGKVVMGPTRLMYPMPVLLIGANIDEKPNFLAIAWSGIASDKPPMMSVALHHSRYTFRGVLQNMTFSINLPSEELLKEVDYCGSATGAKVDKVKVCRFKVFYGKLGNAPLIEQCPVNLECKVVQVLDLGSHALVVGRVEETHISEDCLTDGKPDIDKIKPFAFALEPYGRYL